MDGFLRIEGDPGLLTNRRMSLEIGVGLATLAGRRLCMPWGEPIGHAPGPGPARSRHGGAPDDPAPRPSMLDLWEIPLDPVTDEEWADAGGAAAHTLHWGDFTKCVYLADPDPVPASSVIDFANGRTRFVRVPDTGECALRIAGRPLAWYSYFFHATSAARRRLLDAMSQVLVRTPYREFGATVASDLGDYNLVHVRRTDMVRGIRPYAGVTPSMIGEALAAILPTDETLVIATEADPGSTLFDPIKRLFGDVVFLTDVVLGDHAMTFGGLPFSEDNALGVVTQLVATHAARFIGTIGSTFTGLIQRERCRLDPSEPFRYTADFTPPGPEFRDGHFIETGKGRYTWNRLGLQVPPDVLAWLREWPEAVVSPDDHPVKMPVRNDRSAEVIHAVVCTDSHPYADWQCRFQEYTWQRVGQPGELVRLVACPDAERAPRHLQARVVTTGGRNDHPRAPGHYPGFNRLWSLGEWLDIEHPEGTVLLLDSDFAFRGQVRTTVEPGEIVAQKWYGFDEAQGLPEKVAAHVAVDGTRVRPFTWPMLIDAADLAKLLPRWIEVTADLRANTGMWEADMFGLVAAVADTDLIVRYETLGAWMNWPEEFVAGAPIIHYCQPVIAKDGIRRLWYKQDYQPWEPLDIDPDDAQLDYCRDLLHLLDEFITLQNPDR
jgi:hypothetical protein